MNDDGTMARVPQLIEFCKKHSLVMTSVADLIRYRMKHERYIHRRSETVLQTPSGPFRAIWYSSDIEPERHLAWCGEISPGRNRFWSGCIRIAFMAMFSVQRTASART